MRKNQITKTQLDVVEAKLDELLSKQKRSTTFSILKLIINILGWLF